MLEDLQIRHYSPTTIRLYLSSVAEFAVFHGCPDQFAGAHSPVPTIPDQGKHACQSTAFSEQHRAFYTVRRFTAKWRSSVSRSPA